ECGQPRDAPLALGPHYAGGLFAGWLSFAAAGGGGHSEVAAWRKLCFCVAAAGHAAGDRRGGVPAARADRLAALASVPAELARPLDLCSAARGPFPGARADHPGRSGSRAGLLLALCPARTATRPADRRRTMVGSAWRSGPGPLAFPGGHPDHALFA